MTSHGTGIVDAGVVEVEGARLPYRIEGDGQPCIVVGSVAYYSRCFSRALRERIQLVFVDMRHFVAADGDDLPGGNLMDTYADDIERVRQALALGDVVVIGHSSHATIALEYARRYSTHVRGVVMTGAPPYASDDDYQAASDRLWDATASEERKALLARKRAELTAEVRGSLSPTELFLREYLARGPSQWYDPAYDGAWLWEGVTLNMHVLERLFQALADATLDEGQITAPVLIAHGRFDYGAPYPLWESTLDKLPRHTFVLFDKSGHTPSLEEPERFDQTLLDWIARLS